MDIYFSQVREDPSVELNVIKSFGHDNINILCVTSGGCTVLSMLNKNVKITSIDINMHQNCLAKYKLFLCSILGKKELFDFLEGNNTKEYYDNFINKYRNKFDCEYVLEHIYCSYGLNYCGRYEKLFRDLINSDFNYELVFNSNNLVKNFGENAVKFSGNNSFSDHFRNVINKYNGDNYFKNSIMYGSYVSTDNDLPHYFNNLDNIKKYITNVNFIDGSMIDHLGANEETYHIIQISNVTDWMNINDVKNLIKCVHRYIKENGYIIARRLLGDYKLRDILCEYFEIEYVHDKSEFYSEVIVGKKINI